MRRTEIKRRSPLARGVGIRRRNEARAKRLHRRNFGDEADAVRAMPCLCSGVGPLVRCCGATVDAHVTSRGAGGGRFDVIPLCWWHHNEQHTIGIESFAGRYGLDLRAEADRIAIEHPCSRPAEDGEPGLRPVARRWANDHALPDGYDRDALFGWVRRRMEREAARLSARASTLATAYGETSAAATGARFDANDRACLSHAVMLDLGEPFTIDPSGEHGLAWSLCEAAGWPEVHHG